MERARDTGMPALTGKVTLVQETSYDRQAGTLLYVPVYRPDLPKATIAQRREALRGFVFAPFRMNDLMQGIMGNQFPDVRLEIFDGEEFDPEARLYASDMPAVTAESEPPRFSQKVPFTFNNKTWLLRVESRQGFEAPEESRLQAGILIGGLIISVLLFAITWSVVSTQVHAKALALRMTQALRGSERRFRAVHDHAAFGIVQTTPDGLIVHTNPAFQRMIGYSEEELQGSHWSLFSAADDQAENQRLRRELLNGERDAYHMEKRYISKDGRLVWGNLAVTGVRAEDGTLQFLVALIEEITARKQQEETITHQAFHDALTGLPNRMRFAERLDQALVKARREKTPMALMFLDLDHFKDVNDALGHGAGDAVLQEVARRLRSCVRATDTVARIGGDEFTVLLPVIDGPNGAIQVASKILQVLPVTTMIDGKPLTVTPSIGISLFPEHGQDAESLIAQADQAMYASKQSGRNRFTLVSPNAAEPALTR